MGGGVAGGTRRDETRRVGPRRPLALVGGVGSGDLSLVGLSGGIVFFWEGGLGGIVKGGLGLDGGELC